MIATGLWYVSNKLMKPNLRDQDVEWGFCFDVHLNAFIPILVILHFVQLFVYHAIIGTSGPRKKIKELMEISIPYLDPPNPIPHLNGNNDKLS